MPKPRQVFGSKCFFLILPCMFVVFTSFSLVCGGTFAFLMVCPNVCQDIWATIIDRLVQALTFQKRFDAALNCLDEAARSSSGLLLCASSKVLRQIVCQGFQRGVFRCFQGLAKVNCSEGINSSNVGCHNAARLGCRFLRVSIWLSINTNPSKRLCTVQAKEKVWLLSMLSRSKGTSLCSSKSEI